MFQLKILRQLVELQLCHNAEIKAIIDRAWGVSQNKHKKKDASTAPPDPSDPKSQERLQLVPIGQDLRRTRYWVADGPCTSIAYRDSSIQRPLFASIYGGTYFRCQLTRRALFIIPWRNQIVHFSLLTAFSIFTRFPTRFYIDESMEDHSDVSSGFFDKRGILDHH